jgi:hypothetical protein
MEERARGLADESRIAAVIVAIFGGLIAVMLFK